MSDGNSDLIAATEEIQGLKEQLSAVTRERDALKAQLAAANTEHGHELDRKNSDLLAANFRHYELQAEWQLMIQALDDAPKEVSAQIYQRFGVLKLFPPNETA